jgi:4-carboxymuconolactone decarboxylase
LFISAGLLGFPTAINAVPIVRNILADRSEAKDATKLRHQLLSPTFPLTVLLNSIKLHLSS